MFFPWHAFTLLALEANSVIALRLAKIARGGSQAVDEIGLMFSEKTSAASEAVTAMINGGTMVELVDGYRVHVAANRSRLEVAR